MIKTLSESICDLFAEDPNQFYTIKELTAILIANGIARQDQALSVKATISRLHGLKKISSRPSGIHIQIFTGSREPRKKYGFLQ